MHLGLPGQGVHQLVQMHGDLHVTQGLAVGIERAAAFLASNSRTGEQMRAVYMCGGGSRIPGLVEALASRLRLPAEVAHPLANLVVRDGAFDSLVADEVAPLLMLPIGLALRQVA